MFFLQSVFVISLFRIVYSEWIEITQSVQSLSEAANNRSLVTTNENTFDYSKYKDFFSIIEPEMELVKNITSVQKNSIFSNQLNDQKGEFHMIMANPSENPHLLMHPSNVSTLKSVFSDSIDKMVNDPIQTDAYEIQPENLNKKPSDETDKHLLNINKSKNESSKQTPNTKQNTIVFKRLEFKSLDFKHILKFLTNMQQSFSINSATGIGDKVKFLVQFKDSLLKNIG